MSVVAFRKYRAGLDVEVVTGNLYVHNVAARRKVEGNDSHSELPSGEISPRHTQEAAKCAP